MTDNPFISNKPVFTTIAPCILPDIPPKFGKNPLRNATFISRRTIFPPIV